jgi:hypothetical protein
MDPITADPHIAALMRATLAAIAPDALRSHPGFPNNLAARIQQ